MTNSVKKIYDKMNADGYCSCMMKGDKENAYRIAVDRLFQELADCVYDNPNFFAEKTAPIIEKYRKMIEETGHKVPEDLFLPDRFRERYFHLTNMQK